MMKNNTRKSITITGFFLLSISAILAACTGSNRDISVVNQFKPHKYLGRWYEIARTDNSFQRGKTNAFATYSMNEDGTVKVLNQAYDVVDRKWGKAIGKAKFVDSADSGRLKVSFFGPFYGAYNIVSINHDYKYALVFGNTPEYMWILSRDKTVPDFIKEKYLNKAKAFGVDIDTLIWDKQERTDQPH